MSNKEDLFTLEEALITDSASKAFVSADSEEESSEDMSITGWENLIVYSTDWTSETITSQIAKGNINLKPKFQRRDAWTRSKKSKLIESLILGLPVPPIVLAELPKKKGSYVVLDGKQRLLTLMQFVEPHKKSGYTVLKISGLEIIKSINNKTIDKIQKSALTSRYISAFENQSLRTVIIRGWQNENYLNAIFLRLNSENVPLSPQELRQALNPGEFTNFIDDESVSSKSLHTAMRLKGADFRMRDAELLLRSVGVKTQ